MKYLDTDTDTDTNSLKIHVEKTCYKQLINFFVVVVALLWRWKGQLKTKHKSQFCLEFIKPFWSFLVISSVALGLGRRFYIVLCYKWSIAV